MAIQHELELTFPTERVTQPIICSMARAHDVVFNFDRVNVSHRRGRVHLTLTGEDISVKAAEGYLKAQGVEVKVARSGAYEEKIPLRPERRQVDTCEPVISKKLWVTFMDEHFREPITWQMMHRFAVTFDVRQSSTGETVGIMAILLTGPASHVEGAMAFLREKGAEVEPIEKTVIEG